MSGERTLLTARWLVGHRDGAHCLLERGELVIEGGQVVFVGHRFPGEVAERLDFGESIVSPGFIDLDALADLDTTVLGLDTGPAWKSGRVWPKSYVERGPREMYDPDELAFQKRFAFTQLIRNGITTALPIASLFYREWGETIGEFEAAADAAEELGLRAYLGPAYRTGNQVVDPDGTVSAVYDERRGLDGLEAAIDFARQVDGRASGRLRGMLAPDRIETCTAALLEGTARASEELDMPVRLHCCQSPTELALLEARHGCGPIEWLDRLGVLSHRWLLPHGTHATPEELRIVARANASLVHCPLVAGRHGVALRSFAAHREAGLSIGLGTDTWPPDMILNMQLGSMLCRVVEGEPLACRSEDLYDAATLGGADALARPDLGRLAIGARADITVVSLARNLQGTDPIQSLMSGGSGRDVTDVFVDGRRIMAARRIENVDEAGDFARAQAQLDRLISRYPERTLGHPPLERIFHASYRRIAADD